MDKEDPRPPLSSDDRRPASSHPGTRSTAAANYAKKTSASVATGRGSPSASVYSHAGSRLQTPPRSGSLARGTSRQGSPQRAHWNDPGASAYDDSPAPPLRISTTTPPESPPSSFDARSAGRSRSSGRGGSNSGGGGGGWRGGSLDRPPTTTARSAEDLGRARTLPRHLPLGNPSDCSSGGRDFDSPSRVPSVDGAFARGASPARSDRSEESTATFAFAQSRHAPVPAVRRGYPFQSSLEPTSWLPARGSSVSRSHSHGRPPLGPSQSAGSTTTTGGGSNGLADKKASLGFGSRLQAEVALVDDRGLLTHAKPFLRKGQGTNVSTLHGFNQNDTRRTASVDRGSVHVESRVAAYNGSTSNNFMVADSDRRGSSVGRGTMAYFDDHSNSGHSTHGGRRVPSPPLMTALRSTRAPSLDAKTTNKMQPASRPRSGSVGAYPDGDFSTVTAATSATSATSATPIDQLESRPFYQRGSSESRAYSQSKSAEQRTAAIKYASEGRSSAERLRGGSLGRYHGNVRAGHNVSPTASSSSSSGGGGSAGGRGEAKPGSQSVSVLRRKLDDLNEFYQASVGSSRTASPGGSSVHTAPLSAAPASPDTASPRSNNINKHHFSGGDDSVDDVGPLVMERVPHPASSAAAKARYHASRSSSPTSSVRSNERTSATTNPHPPISNVLATAAPIKRHSLPRRPSGASTGADGNGLPGSGGGGSAFGSGGGGGRGRGADQRRITASSSTQPRNDTRKLAALAAAKRHASSMPRASTTSSSSSSTRKGPTPKPKEPSPARGSEAYLETGETLASASSATRGESSNGQDTAVKRVVALPAKPPPSSRHDLVGGPQTRYEVETGSADSSCFGADTNQAKRFASENSQGADDKTAATQASKVAAVESKRTFNVKSSERDGCAEVRHHPRYREFYFMRWKLGLDPAIVAQQMQQIGLDPEVIPFMRIGILFAIHCHVHVCTFS